MNTTRREVIRGIATILWASAWADHADDHRCTNLSGCEITAHMPPIPWVAWLMAGRLLRAVEKANGPIASILDRAERADSEAGISLPYRYGRSGPQRFGECIAYESMGAGVSWEDDHAAIPGYRVPRDYGDRCFELRILADTSCTEETDRKPCGECSAYVRPGEKCSNCGTYSPCEEKASRV